MHLERFVAWDNVADTRVDRTDLRDGTGPFGDGVVIAGLENPQRQPSEPPWQGAKIAHSTHLGQTIRTEPTSSLGLFANFEGATTGLSVSGGHFQDGDRALYAHSSEFLVDTVSGLVQFFGNSIGIHADSCVSGLGEPAAATVDGADFEGHGLAATRWDSSNFSLRNSSFANDVSAVDIFGLLREGELVRNDLQAGVASQSGINITLGNPAGPPPSPLPALTVKQNDFQGYQPAPGRLAIRLVSPVAPPCGSGSMYLDVTDNWWGCPDWASLPFWGGPVTTCGIPFSPPCADISVIPPGVQFFDWSHSPNVP